MTRRVGLVGPLALVLCAGAGAAQDVEQVVPRVLQELKAEPVDCPEDLTDGWTCGRFHSGFSRLKFELEVELDLKDFEARALTSWRLRAGRYERSWAVHGQKVTLKFGRTSRIVALRQVDLEDEVDEDAEGEGAEPADPASRDEDRQSR